MAASLFLSPGGAKFTGVMLSLANHAMLQELRTLHTGACCTWAPHAGVPVGLMGFDGSDRGQLGSRGRRHARLLAQRGRQAPGAAPEEVPEDRRGAGPLPPRVPEESPVSPGGPARCYRRHGNAGAAVNAIWFKVTTSEVANVAHK